MLQAIDHIWIADRQGLQILLKYVGNQTCLRI